MYPTRAWAPKGKRAVVKEKFQKGTNLTTIATMTQQGVSEMLCVEGAANGAILAHFIRTQLHSVLTKNHTLILDNASFHHSKIVQKAVAECGCHVRFLPSYSPDFSPIELAFSQIKRHLRKVRATSLSQLRAAIVESTNNLTSTYAQSCFNHCGYLNHAQY